VALVMGNFLGGQRIRVNFMGGGKSVSLRDLGRWAGFRWGNGEGLNEKG